jgi:MFS family permease
MPSIFFKPAGLPRLRPGTAASRIFFGLASFQALAMFRRGIFYTFLAVYLRSELGLSVTGTTLFETIPMVLNVLFQTFVWGRLTDRLQLRRSLIVTGEIVAGIGHLAMWYFHTIAPDPQSAGWVIITGLAVIEVFWSMSNIGWSAYISDVYDVGQRNAIQGRFSSIGGGGRIVGAFLGGVLYAGLGQSQPGSGFRQGSIFFVSAAVMFVSVIPLLFMPEGGIHYQHAASPGDRAGARPTGGDRARANAIDNGSSPGDRARANAPGDRAASGNLLVFSSFLAAMLLINSGINSLGAFRAQFLDLADGFAASARTISLVLNVESATLIVVGLFVGFLGRKLGIKVLLILGAAAGLVSLLIHATAAWLGLMFVAAAFKGLSDGCVMAAAYTFASTLIPPEKRGRWFAIYNATFFLSWGLSATFITGPIIDRLIAAGAGTVPAYRAGFATAAGLITIGMVILLALMAALRRGNEARRLA